MKAIICVLGLAATVAYAQLDFSTLRPIPEHPAHGFGGYAFGSSKDYIRRERAADGYVVESEPAGWIWYEHTTIEGCGMNAGYEFSGRSLLVSGVWSITNNDICFGRVQDLLSRTYGSDLEMEIIGSRVRVEMEIPYTRIVHTKNDEYHGVIFSDTTPVATDGD